MARVVIATGVDKGDPFKGFKPGKLTAVLDEYAGKALKRLNDHGREYTGGIDPKITKPSNEERLIATEDQRAFFVNEGTRDHYIAPRSGGLLAFQSNYSDKTLAGVIPSRPGGASGEFVYSAGHFVSGIEPRDVEELIAKALEKDFIREITKAAGA